QREIHGIEYYMPAISLMQNLQQHRGMASAWLSGDASYKEPLLAKKAELDGDLRRMDAVDGRIGRAIGTSEQWTLLRAACVDLLEKTPSLSAGESFARHTRLIGDVIGLIQQVGDASSLLLDSDV